jgi:hypothetical protein
MNDATIEWTIELVARLFCDGGFAAIAEVHNLEIQKLKTDNAEEN